MRIFDRFAEAKFINQAKRNFNWESGSIHTGDCEIADNAAINDATIDITGGVYIEEGVHFGREVMILSCSHPVGISDGIKRRNSMRARPIRICKNAYVGSRAIILDGVIIGESSYIAAGAVVTKNVPAFKIYAGVPAIEIKK